MNKLLETIAALGSRRRLPWARCTSECVGPRGGTLRCEKHRGHKGQIHTKDSIAWHDESATIPAEPLPATLEEWQSQHPPSTDDASRPNHTMLVDGLYWRVLTDFILIRVGHAEARLWGDEDGWVLHDSTNTHHVEPAHVIELGHLMQVVNEVDPYDLQQTHTTTTI